MAMKFITDPETGNTMKVTGKGLEEELNKLLEKDEVDAEDIELIRSFTTDAKDVIGKANDGVIDQYNKIEVKGGDALTSEIDKNTVDEKNNEVNVGDGKKEKSGFKSFVDSVGSAFRNIAEGAEKKLETVYDDREKRMMFLSGLNTVIEASSFTPITQAKSPFGKIASGQKKGFLESEAIGTKRKEIEAKRLQALKQPKRVADPELTCSSARFSFKSILLPNTMYLSLSVLDYGS